MTFMLLTLAPDSRKQELRVVLVENHSLKVVTVNVYLIAARRHTLEQLCSP